MTLQETRHIANLPQPWAQLEAAGEMRSMCAKLIKARGQKMPQQQAGYKAAILSLSHLEMTLQRGTGPYKGPGERGRMNTLSIY